MKVGIISSQDLDTSCWSIQLFGKEYCQKCQYEETRNCGANTGNARLIKEGKMQPKVKELK